MGEGEEDNIYVVQQVQISSQSESQDYEQIEQFDVADSLQDINELDRLYNTTLKKTPLEVPIEHKHEPKHITRLQVIDDYIRNFLVKNHMQKTLESFQKEWYEQVQKRQLGGYVLDAHLESEMLRDQVNQTQNRLDNAIVLSEKAKASYDQLLKERDFHKMHHQRVQKQKKKLNENLERLRALQGQFSKKYEELQGKYNFAMKEKMLIKIERDKIKAELQASQPKQDQKISQTKAVSLPKLDKTNKIKFTPFPPDGINPLSEKNVEAASYKQCMLAKTQKAHNMGVCAITFHPKKPIVGTGSDDMLWKIWTAGQSELIMSGQGHKDWVSSMKFHPKGQHIITASGDATVKIWDFLNTACTFTFSKEHLQPIWAIDLNYLGDYAVSGAMDHSSRLLDINIGKCRSVYRGHVDAVNSVNFMPYNNLFASCSTDKTVSIWDIRTSLCIQTFYGHESSVTGLKYSPKGDKIVSCDAHGVIKSWDLRANKCINNFSCDNRAALCIGIDRSGTILGVGCDDGLLLLFNESTGQQQQSLKGHDENTKIQAIDFDSNSKMIATGGADCSYRIWQ